MINYIDLINKTKNTDFELTTFYKGLRMQKHMNPVSIAEPEFNFITNCIVKNNLKNGYEVATAFGISMLAAAIGFKQTGGKLVTMDAYIEEQFNSCSAYDEQHTESYQNSDGFKTAQFLIDLYNVKEIVDLNVGFSPTDTSFVIKKTFNNDKLDYVFIDALHTEDAVIKDIESIIPFLNDKFILFLHDVHCFETGKVQEYIREKFNKYWTVADGCEHPGAGYNLSYINNL